MARTSSTLSLQMLLLTALGVLCCSQDVAKSAETDDASSDRLAFMKQTLDDYVVSLTGVSNSLGKIRRIEEPLLRWDNPVSKVPDGTLFLWTDTDGHPAIAAQVFIAGGTKDLWLHEFQSLTAEPFDVMQGATSIWTPRRAGVQWQRVPDSPTPADSRVARLVQMRQLARRFSAEDDFEGRSRWELRLLSTPVYRYGGASDDDNAIDGAIFAYAHGTDPEALLLLEARKTDAGSEWSYALAPMTGYALRVRSDGKELWNIGWRKEPYDIREPFVCLPYQRRP